MKKLSREELEKELRKEAQGTWILTIVCALIHIVPAFLLNGNGQQMFHMPQWFVVSVFGSGIVAIIGIIILTKNFADFDYDEEAAEE
ncbi:DUF997 family protein [Dysosmobacter sp. NSJ-60]|uniref:DUF997 family protein n=1 Tax=Pusillibacter faecalis TaxID=2714358 RepID=A0A810QDC4_9FIRM|nr:DUF997 family protein [Pusillibacter faecalis]MBC5746456.1 DUF997 family protein [Dysosmobacter hominis]MBS5658062.1 DUF997 family protein [Oscillibacter sp.]MCQ5026512.1 YhdT family protein [Oscillibacter valericigenes]BCK83816.1 hypothetical protein MM59RIKEN_11350 [Pusillibacter faecalis]